MGSASIRERGRLGRVLLSATATALSGALIVSAAAEATGLPSQDRIVGGTPTQISQAPWQVAVELSAAANPGESPADRQLCGGSLVSPTLVITAAHCVANDRGVFQSPGAFSVISGRTDLGSSAGVESELVTYYAFTNAAGQPRYDPATNSWDAVVMQLAQPAAGTPIQLAGPDEAELWARGRSVLASGWGAVSERGGYPDGLLSTELTVYGERCFQDRVDDPQTSICAGSALGDRDTCYGDSGGPIAAPMEGGGYRLVGDTSYGFGKCGSLDPGAYGKVAADPMRSELASLALSLDGTDIVGSGGLAPRSISATQARENSWIWVYDDCSRRRSCVNVNALPCSPAGSGWSCPVAEKARNRRGARFTCRRRVSVSAASGTIDRHALRRWRCR